jgi:hypothetical protein
MRAARPAKPISVIAHVERYLNEKSKFSAGGSDTTTVKPVTLK